MLRSTNKAVINKIRQYIIDGVDHEYFELKPIPILTRLAS